MPHRSINSYRQRLKELDQDISNVINEISDRALEDSSMFFDEIKGINNFSMLFGYGIPKDGCCLFEHALNSESHFLKSLRNIFYRRTYFYLAKLNEYCESSSPELERLRLHFCKYRRKMPLSNSEVNNLITSLNGEHNYELSPLYETFIDPELFTSLSLLNSKIGLKNTNATQIIKNNLMDKVRNILSNNISNELLLLPCNERYPIKDEANILWGIRLLYQLDPQNFIISKNIQGESSFKELIINSSNNDPISRRSPNENDKIFEVTPEIINLERTNLYIALNLLKIYEVYPDKDNDFKKDILESCETIISQFVINNNTENLYFKITHAQCIKSYFVALASDELKKLMQKVIQAGSQISDKSAVYSLCLKIDQLTKQSSVNNGEKPLTTTEKVSLYNNILSIGKTLGDIAEPYVEKLSEYNILT